MFCSNLANKDVQIRTYFTEINMDTFGSGVIDIDNINSLIIFSTNIFIINDKAIARPSQIRE